MAPSFLTKNSQPSARARRLQKHNERRRKLSGIDSRDEFPEAAPASKEDPGNASPLKALAAAQQCGSSSAGSASAGSGTCGGCACCHGGRGSQQAADTPLPHPLPPLPAGMAAVDFILVPILDLRGHDLSGAVRGDGAVSTRKRARLAISADAGEPQDGELCGRRFPVAGAAMVAVAAELRHLPLALCVGGPGCGPAAKLPSVAPATLHMAPAAHLARGDLAAAAAAVAASGDDGAVHVAAAGDAAAPFGKAVAPLAATTTIAAAAGGGALGAAGGALTAGSGSALPQLLPVVAAGPVFLDTHKMAPIDAQDSANSDWLQQFDLSTITEGVCAACA